MTTTETTAQTTETKEAKMPSTSTSESAPTSTSTLWMLWGRITHSSTTPILVALIVISIILSALTDRFFTVNNISNIVAQSAVVGIAAVGATFVIITAGIDLSVGATMGFAGIVAGLAMGATGNPLFGIGVAILAAVAVGVFNGISVAVLNLGPFIVTLATMGMAAGLTLQLSQGQSIYDFPDLYSWLGSARIGPIPVAAIFTLLMFVVGHFVLTKTTFGHKVFAVGGNREAARLSGIHDRRILFGVYVLAAFCAGLSAVVLSGRLGAATPTAGSGIELQVIAAVVIGGTSLYGGKGSMVGTLVGVLLIGVISNGLTLIGVGVFWVQFVQSAMIFLAVLLDSLNTRRLNRRKVIA